MGLRGDTASRPTVVPLVLIFGWLVTLIALEFVYYRFGQVTADIYSVLPRRDWAQLRQILLEAAFYTCFALLAKAVALSSGKLLARALRRNLCAIFNRKILRAARGNGLDNVDQRVTEDIISFTDNLVTIMETLLLAPGLVVYYTIRAYGNVSWLGICLIYTHFVVGILLVRGFVLKLQRVVALKEQREADYRAEHRNIQVNRQVEESLQPALLLRRLNAYHVPRLMSIAKKMIVTEAAIEAVNALISYSGTILNFVLLAVEIGWGRWRQSDNVGDLAALISRSSFISLYLIFQLSRLSALADVLGSFGASVQRLYELFKAPDHAGLPNAFDDKWSVHLDRLPGRRGDLLIYPHGLSLELSPGKNALVLGPNGSGKSSLIRFITGSWADPQVHINRPYDQSRPFVLVCPEVPFLFTGSLLDLLEIDCQSVPLDGARLAEILGVVGLKLGLEEASEIRALGWWRDRLTPGQRHRLSLARVLWHQPHLALFDETFASMEAEEIVRIIGRLRELGITFLVTMVESRFPEWQEFCTVVNI